MYDGGATLTGYNMYYKKVLDGLNVPFTKGDDLIPAS
jgi:hypothetical protein